MAGFRICCGKRLNCTNTRPYPYYIKRYYTCSVCGRSKKTYESVESVVELKYQIKLFSEKMTNIFKSE